MAAAAKYDSRRFSSHQLNQPELVELSQQTKAKVIPFSTQQKVAGAYLFEEQLYFKDEAIMPVSELGVPGSHNVENALAAIAVAK